MEENNTLDLGENSQESAAEEIIEQPEASTSPAGEIDAPVEDPEPPASEIQVADDEIEAEPAEQPAADSQPADDEIETEPAEQPAAEIQVAEDEIEAEPAEQPAAESQPADDEIEAAPDEQPAAEIQVAEDEIEAEPAEQLAAAAPEPEADASAVRSMSEEPEQDDGRAWYVVHCYSGYENKVRHNLEQRIESMGMKNLIFDVVVPTEEEIEVKEGKRRTVERRVFPGYILVNMIMGEESWYVVRNTPGVTSFVGMGEEPTPLRPEEVAQIIRRMEADAPRIKVTFKQGERVRIIDGPFNDFRGTVDEIDMERAKVRVMVNFFGRETPVELDFLQVEKS